MNDRQKAFAALEAYREIMYSDAEPQQMLDGLQVLAKAVEHLELDENVWAMVQGMFEQTSMRVNLIVKRDEERDRLRFETINSLSYLSKWSAQFLESIRGRYVEGEEWVRDAIHRRAERHNWYENNDPS